jgi:hypothetical protein
MEKKYPIGGTVTILINVDSNTIESVYVDTAEAIDACRNNRNLSPLTFPVIGRATPQGIGWVKGAPREMKPHYAKVPSKLFDHFTYKAIIIPNNDAAGYWWAVGDGFAFDLKSEEIIEHLDESQPQPGRE